LTSPEKYGILAWHYESSTFTTVLRIITSILPRQEERERER
jgi:hypothetical protein